MTALTLIDTGSAHWLQETARLLGLTAKNRERVHSPADFAALVLGGLSGKAVGLVQRASGTTIAEFVGVLGVAPRTYSGLHKRDKIGLVEGDRLYRIASTIAKASVVLGAPDRAATWLHTPLPALNNDTPFSRLTTEIGARRVDEVLTAIEHGVYV